MTAAAKAWAWRNGNINMAKREMAAISSESRRQQHGVISEQRQSSDGDIGDKENGVKAWRGGGGVWRNNGVTAAG